MVLLHSHLEVVVIIICGDLAQSMEICENNYYFNAEHAGSTLKDLS